MGAVSSQRFWLAVFRGSVQFEFRGSCMKTFFGDFRVEEVCTVYGHSAKGACGNKCPHDHFVIFWFQVAEQILVL